MHHSEQKRCEWVSDDPLYINYHDNEWGIPLFDDQKLFEFLILEGAQAGLSWITILKKREAYRLAFDNFQAELIANYNQHKVQQLLNNAGIVRNRLKILATIANAKAYLQILQTHTTFTDYIWQFVGGKPITNHWQTLQDVPTSTQQSEQMSKDLKQRGFKFVGKTICYAYMQAVGMVNDHTQQCFRWHELTKNKH